MKIIQFLLPRFEYILLMALFWSVSTNGPKLLNLDGDLPRHLLVGRLIRETGSVPTTDTFSFRTEGFPSIPHEWLSQVLFSIADDLMGLSGVVILTALLITVVWALVYYDAYRRSNNLFIALFLTAVGISVSMIHVLPRPHLFTYLFTALWIIVLEQVTGSKPRLWWSLPVLMLLWVNLHGMFVLGIIIWGIYLVGGLLENPTRTWLNPPASKSLLLGGSLSIVATFFSPSGLHIWEAITSLGSNAYITSRIPEYQSANFHMPETWPFILLLMLTIIGFARSTTKANWAHILLVAAFAAIALYTGRMLPLFAIVAVPIASKSLSELVHQEFPQSRFLAMEKNFAVINSTSNGLIWVVLVFVVITVAFRSGQPLDLGKRGNVFDAGFFPVEAVDWLKSNPQVGPMFNEFDWGGYLLLKLSPRQQIFMDGHTHIYGEALTREYETVITQREGWQDILDRYQIRWAIVRSDTLIARALEEMHWQVLYEDKTAIILRRP